MKKRMFLIDVNNGIAKVVEADTLEEFYKLIGCNYVEIVNRKIGDRRYEIICDEEGTFSETPIPSAIGLTGTMFVGNLLIAGMADAEGELTSLTDEDITDVTKHIASYIAKMPDGTIKAEVIVADMNY